MENLDLLRLEDRTIYPAVGKCIYCGETEGKLTSEHIFPDGLGARHELPEASCIRCMKAIGRMEQYCLRTLFGNLRYRHSIRSRKGKRKGLPEFVPFLRFKMPDGSMQDKPYSRGTLPALQFMLHYPLPSIITGVPDTGNVHVQLRQFGNDPAEILSNAGASGLTSFPIRPDYFNSFLAKLAHCLVVSIVGLESFKPLLIDMILGKDGFHWNEYLGSEEEIAEPDQAHEHYAYMKEVVRLDLRKVYYAVVIRLFASTRHTPTYVVVVGEKVPKR